MGATNSLENSIINSLLVGAGLYVGLITAVTDEEAGTVTEVSSSGTAYARQAVEFTTSTTGVTANTADITFPVATGSGFGTVTHIGLWTTLTTGTLRLVAALAVSRTVGAGEQLIIAAGDIDITVT